MTCVCVLMLLLGTNVFVYICVQSSACCEASDFNCSFCHYSSHFSLCWVFPFINTHLFENCMQKHNDIGTIGNVYIKMCFFCIGTHKYPEYIIPCNIPVYHSTMFQ